ncbi:MAG: excinuclease ABC subunit UvrA [Acidobacteriaceae bacterium]
MSIPTSVETLNTASATVGASEMVAHDAVIVRGARTHNLKSIDVEIPHNQMTVVTGVSGSGKSSLAFDTIYAEGQRRYVESLSAYARQFLERMEKPDADLIDGIAPAIAIRQKNSTRNPRSTVATATEIYDYLRLLFARIGHTYCLVCGNEVKRDTVDEVAATLLGLGEGTRLNVLFPLLVQGGAPAQQVKTPKKRTAVGKGAGKKAPIADLHLQVLKEKLFELRKRGFNRLYQNGQIFEFSTPESLLDIDFAAPVFLLVDRVVVSAEARARLVDATEIGYRESGEVIFETVPRDESASERLRFSGRFECKIDHIRYEDPEPRLFSFNNPYGACPKCQGFGNTIDFDLNLVIPDPTLTLDEGAIDPWTKPKYTPYQTELKRWAKMRGIPMDVPWCDLCAEFQQAVLNGEARFPGIHGFFDYLERKKYKLHVRVFLSRYRGYAICPECKGQRLRPEARTVRVAGKNICDVCAFTVEDAAKFFASLKLSTAETEIADKVLAEVRDRLKFLNEVGLDYLTLDRLSATLSGGESQRIQLATSLGSRLVGALYVLDEPSIGLHPRDTERLVNILLELRDLGNTILVVEHDPDVMRSADRILDLGPGAGEHGGRLMAAGTYDEIAADVHSLTGRYLSRNLSIQVPAYRRTANARRLTVKGARANNIKGIDVTIPLGMLVAITGVSGSGKSTLVHEVLFKGLSAAKGGGEGEASGETLVNACKGLFKRLDGDQHITDVVLVDQSPIGRTPRSNPVTYIKAFDAIRELYASQPESKKRGFAAGHFSFNVPGGRCEVCEGDGTVTVEMQFLADVELVCEECQGTRFKASVLEVKYKGKNIHDALQLTVKEALQFFQGVPKIVDKLRTLEEVGLGYLRLGQSASTLSGGEAQRMKLAAHLGTRRSEQLRVSAAAMEEDDENPDPVEARRRYASRPLYIFDEPTTGLHFDDISKLLSAFRRLIDAGGSVLVIEHNLDVIKTADWVIDMGPEGGTRGGKIVGEGTPEQIARISGSYTGEWLRRVLPA